MGGPPANPATRPVPCSRTEKNPLPPRRGRIRHQNPLPPDGGGLGWGGVPLTQLLAPYPAREPRKIPSPPLAGKDSPSKSPPPRRGRIRHQNPLPPDGGGLGWGGRPLTQLLAPYPAREPRKTPSPPLAGEDSPSKSPPPWRGRVRHQNPLPPDGGGLGWGGRPLTQLLAPYPAREPRKIPSPLTGEDSPSKSPPHPWRGRIRHQNPLPLGGGGLGWGAAR